MMWHLDHQLCFLLYASSRKLTKIYQKLLDPIDLTYTQYLVMLVLWEEEKMTVKGLGNRLKLDSGTLTPLLKKLEIKKLVSRNRDERDERKVVIELSDHGRALSSKAEHIPNEILKTTHFSMNDGKMLYSLLRKLLDEK
ncbi:MAG: MarR family transcriptional regulator [Acholeplasmataceae bacterium]|nr:MarR family transcriptional regulator [Acholeplasmataceae bacterium]